MDLSKLVIDLAGDLELFKIRDVVYQEGCMMIQFREFIHLIFSLVLCLLNNLVFEFLF
jgi:hypothetical protein